MQKKIWVTPQKIQFTGKNSNPDFITVLQWCVYLENCSSIFTKHLLFQISFSTNYDGDHYEANVAVNLTAMLVIATLFISVFDS